MDKIIRLQQAMPSDMEAVILQDAANRFYLTGMKSSAGTVLVTRNKAWLIIDFRYFEEAEEKVKNCRVIEEKNLNSQIKQLLEAERISALSLHTGLVTLEKYRQLETALTGISLDISDSLSGSWIPCAGKRMKRKSPATERHSKSRIIPFPIFSDS